MDCAVNGDGEITLTRYEENTPGEGTYPDATLKVKIMHPDGTDVVEEDLEFPFPFKVPPYEP